jgi:hypothetical protein
MIPKSILLNEVRERIYNPAESLGIIPRPKVYASREKIIHKPLAAGLMGC